MPLYAPVQLTCPCCTGQFTENAKLVRPGGSAWCPHCETMFRLDETIPAMRAVLVEAKEARRHRKQRLAELKARWSDVPEPQLSPAPPVRIGDVLTALDDLLLRMDGMGRKAG